MARPLSKSHAAAAAAVKREFGAKLEKWRSFSGPRRAIRNKREDESGRQIARADRDRERSRGGWGWDPSYRRGGAAKKGCK